MLTPLVSQDAVGDLLGNMGGAGMRNMNADRRRHRIMQSRGTRALGEGPQAAAAMASGPAAQSAQHRYLHASAFSGKQFFSSHRVQPCETSANRSNVKVLEKACSKNDHTI